MREPRRIHANDMRIRGEKLAVGFQLIDLLDFDGLSGPRGEVGSGAISRFSEAISINSCIVERLYSLREFSESERYAESISREEDGGPTEVPYLVEGVFLQRGKCYVLPHTGPTGWL